MVTRTLRVFALALVVVGGAAGCATNGALFTHVTEPIDVNFDRSPVHVEEGSSEWHTVQYYVQVDWGHNGLGQVAKQHGLKRIHYADLETLSILGIYTQRRVHVYGER